MLLVDVDVDDWDEILHGCASAASMDINTSLIWDESINSGLNKLSNFMRCLPLVGQVIGGISYARHGEDWSVGGNAAVDFTNAKYRADRNNFYTMFQTNLAKEMALGPQAAVKYIQSRVDLARLAMSNVHYKFREAGKINDEVSHAWDVGIRRLDTMQVVINATFSVALSFMPGGVLVLTAAGAGYPLACKLATTMSDLITSNTLGYVKKEDYLKKRAWDASMNAGVNAAQNAVKFGIRNKVYEEMAEKTERTLVNRAAQFTAQGGGEQFSRAQRRSMARAVAQHEAAVAKAATSASRANYFVGGLGAAVGLIFMKDDIKRAFFNLAEEIAVPERS
jgi:hypothetical protein